jgi:hypothetical protein
MDYALEKSSGFRSSFPEPCESVRSRKSPDFMEDLAEPG